jgi:hypothetical protein
MMLLFGIKEQSIFQSLRKTNHILEKPFPHLINLKKLMQKYQLGMLGIKKYGK